MYSLRVRSARRRRALTQVNLIYVLFSQQVYFTGPTVSLLELSTHMGNHSWASWMSAKGRRPRGGSRNSH